MSAFLQHTVLKPEGRDAIFSLDFSYSEEDTLKVKRTQYYLSGSTHATSFSDTLIDKKMMPNSKQGLSRNKMISMAFPDLQVGSVIQIQLEKHFKRSSF